MRYAREERSWLAVRYINMAIALLERSREDIERSTLNTPLETAKEMVSRAIGFEMDAVALLEEAIGTRADELVHPVMVVN